MIRKHIRKIFAFTLVFAVIAYFGLNRHRDRIVVVAGSGGEGYGGGGRSAQYAGLTNPHGLALDAVGQLYIVDSGNQAIRKVDRQGIMSTVYRADSKFTDHQLLPQSPEDIAIDQAGTLFFSDSSTHAVYRIEQDGHAVVIAGCGAPGFSGDGKKAYRAKLNSPHGIAFDKKGNLYIADTENNRIRCMDRRGIIKTVAGNGSKGYVDEASDATKAIIETPFSLAFNSRGELFVLQKGAIRKITAKGKISTPVSTNFDEENTSAPYIDVNWTNSIAINRLDDLFFFDAIHHVIERLDRDGRLHPYMELSQPSGLFPPPRGDTQSGTYFVWPGGIAVDSQNNLYVSDSHLDFVARISPH